MRRMFPSLNIQITDLEPDTQYCVLLEMTPATPLCRYKYTASNGWSPAGPEEAQSPHRVYLHPDSPAPGRYWMAQSVSFGRVKLTNTANPPSGQLVLGSMHKYQPRVVVCHTGDVRGLHWAERTTVAFPETQFVAVTAYQNDRITKLKIDNNPFAKGFRENGQSKCKRKHYRKQEEEEIIDVTTPPPEAKKIKLDPLLTPESIKIEDDRLSNVSSNSLSSSGKSSSSPLTVRNYANSPIYSANMGYTGVPPYGYPYFYPYFMQQTPQSWRNGYFYQYSNNLSPNNYGAQDLTVNKVEKPKKLTDFSIKAITGLS